MRAGRVAARGDQGSAAKLGAQRDGARACAALGRGPAARAARPRARCCAWSSACCRRRGARRAPPAASTSARDDARALLRAWLAALDLGSPTATLIAYIQADDFRHADLDRRARAAHERLLASRRRRCAAVERDDLETAATALFDALVPAIPYAPAAAFLGREKRRLSARDERPARVGLRRRRGRRRCTA